MHDPSVLSGTPRCINATVCLYQLLQQYDCPHGPVPAVAGRKWVHISAHHGVVKVLRACSDMYTSGSRTLTLSKLPQKGSAAR